MNRPAASLRFGPVTLIPEERLLLKSGKAVPLTPKAFDLLAVLASNPGRLLTTDELMQAVWPDVVVEESNLAYNVFAIREALGEDGLSERFIETVPKRGYRFIAPIERVEAEIRGGRPEGRRPWMYVGAGLAVGALAVAGLHRPRADPPRVTTTLRFQEPAWGRPGAPAIFVVSPDGRHLEVTTETVDGTAQAWIRTLSALSPRPLPGTESAFGPIVVWSPDSTMLAFDAFGTLKKLSVSGGAPQKVCDVIDEIPVGGSWSRDGVILIGSPRSGVMQCPASGAKPPP